MIDSCLKCTSLIFEILKTNFLKLMKISSFSSLWIDFSKILANNVNLSPRTSLMHDESIDMIVALLKMLVPTNDDALHALEVTRLLIESWAVMTSICKFLPSDLKMVAPQLVTDITAIELKK